MVKRKKKPSNDTGCFYIIILGLLGIGVIKLGVGFLVVVGLFAGAFAIFRILTKSPSKLSIPEATSESPPLSPPSHYMNPSALEPSTKAGTSVGETAAFFGRGVSVQVAGREIRDPLTYVATSARNADASTIITTLSIGDARKTTRMGYWPSYAEATPHQRAEYIDWMAGGRRDPTVQLGIPFIFFYGLERRALIDRQDVDLCRAEVTRLLDIFGPQSNSFYGYATRFLSFLPLAGWQTLTENDIRSTVLPLTLHDELALAVALAWYCEHRLPLPGAVAAIAASWMEEAKRGVVLERAREELIELFSIRYREQHAEGIVPSAGKNPRVVEYHPASGTLLRLSAKPKVVLKDVLARRAQFKPLVLIWNSCVDDLRKLSRQKAGAPDTVTREVWEAMPDELRAQVDHPDLDRWLDLVNHSPRVGPAHLSTIGELASLAGVTVGDKVTGAQGKKIAHAAALLGFAVEPELRIVSRSMPVAAPIAIWRTTDTAVPEATIYAPASSLLSLLLSIVMADDDADDRELELVTKLIEDTFVLDETMRQRLNALREILLRIPGKTNSIAKQLRETKSVEQLRMVGRMLVAVAAADGVLADGEHKALKSIFRSLGLSSSDLDAALVSTGLRLDRHEPVSVAAGVLAGRGEAIPQPPGPEGVQLDHAAIAKILAETREVAEILADVLDDEKTEDEHAGAASTASPATEPAASPPPTTSPFGPIASRLDLKFHPILLELLVRKSWTNEEARSLARKHRLLPGGVIEAINAWSEEELGDALIEEVDGWRLNTKAAERLRA